MGYHEAGDPRVTALTYGIARITGEPRPFGSWTWSSFTNWWHRVECPVDPEGLASPPSGPILAAMNQLDLRPRSIGELLDVAFRLVTRNAKTPEGMSAERLLEEVAMTRSGLS